MQSSSVEPANLERSVGVDLGTDWRNRLYRIPLAHKILIANSAIVAVGAGICAFPGGWVHLGVQNNGCGFDPAAPVSESGSGLGLLGMRERLAMIGSELNIDSAPNHAMTMSSPSRPDGRVGPKLRKRSALTS